MTRLPAGFVDIAGIGTDGSGDLIVQDDGLGQITTVAPDLASQTSVSYDEGCDDAFAADSSGDTYTFNVCEDAIDEIAPDDTPSVVPHSDEGALEFVDALAVDSAGDIFGYDTDQGEVLEFSDGNEPSDVADLANDVAGIAVDPSGAHLYLLDNPGAGERPSTVTEIDLSGQTDPQTYQLNTNFAVAITTDSSGDAFVADSSGTVEEVDSAGDVSQVPDFTVSNPRGITIDPSGDLFAASAASIDELAATPGAVETVVPPLGMPSDGDAAVDAAGDVFVTDGSEIYESPVGTTSLSLYASGLDISVLAADAAGDLFVGNDDHLLELPAGDPSAPLTLPADSFGAIRQLATDDADDVFALTTEGNVTELPHGGQGWELVPVAASADEIDRIAVDGAGDVFAAHQGEDGVSELSAAGQQSTVGQSIYPYIVSTDEQGDLFLNGTIEIPAGSTQSVTLPLDTDGVSGTTYSDGNADLYVTTPYQGMVELIAPPVTATVTVTASQVYGGTPTYSYSDATGPDADSLTGTLVCRDSKTATAAPGSYDGAIGGCHGLSAPTGRVAYVTGATVVTPAPLTVTAPNATIEYGDTTPSTFAPTYSGFVNGENASTLTSPATCGTSAVAKPHAGNYPIACSGAADPDYAFDYVAGALTVTRAPLTVFAPQSTITYGDDVPTLSPIYQGFVNGDSASSFTVAPICAITQSVSGIGRYAATCFGAADSDYDFSYVDGSLTVSKAPLTVVAPSVTVGQGQTAPTLPDPQYVGLAGSDTAPQTPATCSVASPHSDAGTYPVTCSGASDPNYRISYQAGTWTVTPASTGGATITVVAPTLTTVYGDTVPTTLTPTYVSDDGAPTTAATCSYGEGVTPSAAGTYPITCSGAADASHDLHYQAGSLTILRAPLSVVAPSLSIVAQPNPLLVLSPTYLGLVNGDTAPATTPTCGATGDISKMGSYPIACPGAADPNYRISNVAGTLTVTAAPTPPASTITVVAPSPTIRYGQTVPATLSPTYVSTDNATPSTGATCSYSGGATPSTVGSYPITCTGAGDASHPLTYQPGTLTILAAPLTVVAPTVTVAFGDSTPTLPDPQYVGLVNGDTAPATPASCTAASPHTAVGNYAVTCSGADDPDYTIGYQAGTLTVTKAALTVVAPTLTITYGASAPASLTPTYVSAHGETPTTPASCTYDNGVTPVHVGSYPITCTGASDGNHAISYQAGSLHILPAPLYVLAQSKAVTYGHGPGAIRPAYLGLLRGDSAASLTTQASCLTLATKTSHVGRYATACYGAADSDYVITTFPGTVTVLHRTLTVKTSVTHETYQHYRAHSSLPATYHGFVNGDRRSSLKVAAHCTTVRPVTGAGHYAVRCSGMHARDYTAHNVLTPLTLT